MKFDYMESSPCQIDWIFIATHLFVRYAAVLGHLPQDRIVSTPVSFLPILVPSRFKKGIGVNTYQTGGLIVLMRRFFLVLQTRIATCSFPNLSKQIGGRTKDREIY